MTCSISQRSCSLHYSTLQSITVSVAILVYCNMLQLLSPRPKLTSVGAQRKSEQHPRSGNGTQPLGMFRVHMISYKSITNTILGGPCYNYSRIYPKTLCLFLSTLQIRLQGLTCFSRVRELGFHVGCRFFIERPSDCARFYRVWVQGPGFRVSGLEIFAVGALGVTTRTEC